MMKTRNTVPGMTSIHPSFGFPETSMVRAIPCVMTLLVNDRTLLLVHEIARARSFEQFAGQTPRLLEVIGD